MSDKHMKRLAKAKTSLILSHPFIGSIALNMPMILDDTIPTACTNGKEVRYSPAFLDELTDEQVTFLVAHECFHPMLEHMYRMKGRQALRWNKAADYVINQLLHDEKIGRFIEGGCLDKNLYDAGKGTSEGIYALLPEEDGNGPGGSGAPGGTGADLREADGSPAEQAQELAEWRVKIAQAAQAAKMMGKLSANMQRFVDQILTPKVRWQDVLQRFMQRAKTSTRSWARPNRRFISQGLYLPSVSGEALGEIVVAVDCSGSIGAKEIAEFAAEITAIHQDTQPAALHIIYFDNKVCHYDKYSPDDEPVIKPHGGGGTAFSPVFKYVADNNIQPVACVFLTDLVCSDFGPAPDYPVLWVSTHWSKAPWGEVVMM
jgi:predicted metal-dependent peptidase